MASFLGREWRCPVPEACSPDVKRAFVPYGCAVRDCSERVYTWDETEDGLWKQHGENPEHRRFVRRGESGYAWLLEVHRHEEPHDPAWALGGPSWISPCASCAGRGTGRGRGAP